MPKNLLKNCVLTGLKSGQNIAQFATQNVYKMKIVKFFTQLPCLSTKFEPTFYTGFYTAKFANSPLLAANFYPIYTNPITTTTNLINKGTM